MSVRECALLTVMILEDEAIISNDLNVAFEDAGLKVDGIFYSCVGAEAWLKSGSPSIAVIDIGLNDGPCVEVVRTLKERHVPILLHSATVVDGDEMLIFDGLPRIDKPAAAVQVVEAAKRLLDGHLLALLT